MESLATVLRRVPLFADLPPGGFAKIIADLREEVVEPGAVICAEGDLASDFYVIRSGEVLVYVDRAGGERELVDSMGANQWFGESALFNERRRTATIVARTRVELWRLPKDKFTSLIEENPWLIGHFTGVVMERLHAENRQLSELLQLSRADLILTRSVRGRPSHTPISFNLLIAKPTPRTGILCGNSKEYARLVPVLTAKVISVIAFSMGSDRNGLGSNSSRWLPTAAAGAVMEITSMSLWSNPLGLSCDAGVRVGPFRFAPKSIGSGGRTAQAEVRAQRRAFIGRSEQAAPLQ